MVSGKADRQEPDRTARRGTINRVFLRGTAEPEKKKRLDDFLIDADESIETGEK